MAGRKADPFNFDDIYKQAGVEDLFVKKTMGELKQRQAPTGTTSVAASQPSTMGAPTARPAVQAQKAHAGAFDLDFLSSMTGSGGGTPASLSKPSSTANLAGQSGHTQRQAAAPSSNADPFSLFDEVPGAAPVQQHKPAPSPSLASGGTGNLLDFDDGLGFGSTPAAAPQTPSKPAAPQPAATYTAAPAAEPLIPISPTSSLTAAPPTPAPAPSPPAPRYPSIPSSATPYPNQSAAPSPSLSSAPAHAAAPTSRSGSSALEPTPRATSPPAAAPTASAPRSPPPPPYSQHAEHADYTHPQSSASLTSYGSAMSSQYDTHAQARTHGGIPQSYGADSNGGYGQGHASAGTGDGMYSAAAPSLHGGSGASVTSAIGGYLKAFTKKAVKAAKAGIATLEHALENLDQGQQQQQQQQQHGAGAGAARAGSGRSGHADGYGDEHVEHDEALAWAVRLADLAPHAQQQELAHLPPALRRKVVEVLREQARVEHEAVAAGAPHPGPQHPGADAHPSPPRREGLLHPPAPRRSGSGRTSHSGNVVLTTEYRPDTGSSGGEAVGVRPGNRPAGQQQQQEQLPAGGPAAAHAPPSYTSSAHHPPAQAPAPAAVSASAPSVSAQHSIDLLGMGSGELPRAASATPAAAPAPAPQPPMDDLLGFGDVPAAAAAAPSAASSTATSNRPSVSGAPAAAPPPPSPPQPPAAAVPTVIHVDDLDDFLSGGAAASASAAPPPAHASSMHPSTSAPALGKATASPASAGAGSRVGGGASSAALFDMLHDDDDGLGGLDLDGVDVSGYSDLYKGEQGHENEPELRKRLRAQREAAKHAKMKAALAEKLAMEAEEAARREQQVALKDQYKTNIESWRNKNKGNVRGLLGSLQTVLWPDSGWVPVGVGEMLEPGQVRKVWMKANLLVHPDKVRQRNGSPEQVAIADMIFDALKDAWNAFQKTG